MKKNIPAKNAHSPLTGAAEDGSFSAVGPKIALIYDHVDTRYGGAEQILVQLHQLFPAAPLFTSVFDPAIAGWAKSWVVHPSFLQRLPVLRHAHRLLVGFMPLAFESLDLSEFELIISVSSAAAKGILTSPSQLHICYLLTPTRYLWSHQAEYQRDWLTGWLRKLVFSYLKWWDRAAAWRPDVIIPISNLVAQRTAEYYGRTTLPVIYPPVSFAPPEMSEQAQRHSPGLYSEQILPELANLSPFYLIVARLVSYKRIDLAIQACRTLGRNLVIIGEGPDRTRLEKLIMTNPSQVAPATTIRIFPTVLPQELPAVYALAAAFLAPAEEDFGIATLEAQLAGKPVIVFQKSGAAELVQNGVTGLYLADQTMESLINSIKLLEADHWDARVIQNSIAGHDVVQFQGQFKQAVIRQWQLFKKGSYDQ